MLCWHHLGYKRTLGRVEKCPNSRQSKRQRIHHPEILTKKGRDHGERKRRPDQIRSNHRESAVPPVHKHTRQHPEQQSRQSTRNHNSRHLCCSLSDILRKATNYNHNRQERKIIAHLGNDLPKPQISEISVAQKSETSS